MKYCRIIVIIGLLIMALPTIAQKQFTEEMKQRQCDTIKEALRRAWSGYMQYAKGLDVLNPISKTGKNWYDNSFAMTALDAYDTFVLTGMKTEANEAKEVVLNFLRFDADIDVQIFEINIRILGGLLSAYEFDGDQRFLDLATELGLRLLPAFNSFTGMPYRYVNLRTEKVSDSLSNPAEIGTYLLEFGKLTQLTGDSIFYNTAKKATLEVFKRRSDNDLVGTVIDVTSGAWRNKESQIGARIDSYYEYLFKAWKLFGDRDCKEAWEISRKAIDKHLLTKTKNGYFLTRVDMNSGKETRPLYGALDAFYAGLLALSGDVGTASKIQEGNYYMWTHFNMEPEEFNFKTDAITYAGYPLRPENIESCFYLYRATHDETYLFMGQRMIEDILRNCRTEAGFAEVKSVITLELDDSMESFFLAETLKYAYLLFAPESTLDLNKYVFNTEAHPFKIR